MKPALRREYLLTALIITISLISLAPSSTRADTTTQAHSIIIYATGQATRIADNGTSGPATLTLTASAYNDSNHILQIQNATGTLRIVSTKFTITNGLGSANRTGDIVIIADAESVAGQIILQGSVQGSNVSFVSPESRLGSLASLALAGSITTPEAQPTGPTGNSTTLSSNSTGISTQSNTTGNQNTLLTTSMTNSSSLTTSSGQNNATSSVTSSNSTMNSTQFKATHFSNFVLSILSPMTL